MKYLSQHLTVKYSSTASGISNTPQNEQNRMIGGEKMADRRIPLHGLKCLKCPYYLGKIKCVIDPCRECILSKRKKHPFLDHDSRISKK